jgi:NAD-dependent dihydropyrimidine dehydrogenase PreA subunit
MAIQQVDHRRCIGCKTCVITCPVDVFRYDAGTKRAIAKYPSECQICRMCENYCPVGALKITSDKTTPILTCWG